MRCVQVSIVAQIVNQINIPCQSDAATGKAAVV